MYFPSYCAHHKQLRFIRIGSQQQFSSIDRQTAHLMNIKTIAQEKWFSTNYFYRRLVRIYAVGKKDAMEELLDFGDAKIGWGMLLIFARCCAVVCEDMDMKSELIDWRCDTKSVTLTTGMSTERKATNGTATTVWKEEEIDAVVKMIQKFCLP